MRLWEKVTLCVGFGAFAAGLREVMRHPWQDPVAAFDHPIPLPTQRPASLVTMEPPAVIAIPQIPGEAPGTPELLRGVKKDPPIQEIFDFEMMLIGRYSQNNTTPPPPRVVTEKRCSAALGPACVSVDTQSAPRTKGNNHEYTPYIKPVDNEHPVRVNVLGAAAQHKILVCNEGSTKRIPLDGGGAATSPPSGVLVIAMCWDTYGYHLWACLMGIKAILHLENISEDPKIAVLKESFAPQRFGSHSDWEVQKSYNPRYQDAGQWRMWNAVTSHPSNVRSLRDWAGSCFAKVVVGHVPLFDITPLTSKMTVDAALRTSGIERKRRACGVTRIAIVERKSSFHVTNLKELQQFLEPLGSVKVVLFEELPLKAQMETAANTDLMIGTHGNGLTWAAMMEGGVLIEVWGEWPYNTNYRLMARRSNLRYIPISLHQPGCKKRCDVRVLIPLLKPALKEATEHLYNTSCLGQWYDADYLAEAWEEHLYTTGKRKRKKKGMGSPPFLDSSYL